MTEFIQYPHATDSDTASVEPSQQTSAADYDFAEGYPLLPHDVPPVVTHLGSLSRQATQLEGPVSDEDANGRIVRESVAATRDNPRPQRVMATREIVPSTYATSEFAGDANATYATDALCTAWLELYNHQVATGDFPAMRTLRRDGDSRQLSRYVPRTLTKRLPDGSAGERAELFLTPELHARYRAQGLIPETLGGTEGVPAIFWFERDGKEYRAGTNTDAIYLTEGMNPLSAAKKRGTLNSVETALNKVPSLPNAKWQDRLAALEAERLKAERAKVPFTHPVLVSSWR